MVDFLHFCLRHGLGGIALLLATAAALGLAALGVAAGTKLAASRFATGFRQGLRDDRQDVG